MMSFFVFSTLCFFLRCIKKVKTHTVKYLHPLTNTDVSPCEISVIIILYSITILYHASTRCQHSVGLAMGHRLRRWPIIRPTFGRPSKQDTIRQCWSDVAPRLRRWPNIKPALCVCLGRLVLAGCFKILCYLLGVI